MILSQICNIYDGTHQTPKYVDEGVPFYSVEHVSKDDFSNTKFITEEVFTKECQRVSIEQGDILMTRIGSVGVPKFIDWNVRASFYVSLALLKPKTEGINMGWLSYYIQSPNIQRDIWRLTIHVAFPKKINLGDIGKIRIKLPPKAEQESNYVLLKSVDQKINLLTKKKEALETYKKGLMQKIFSQELRFKREDGSDYPEWQNAILEEVIIEIKIKSEYNNQYPILTSSRRGLFFQSDYYSKQVASEDNTGYNVVPRGYFTYRHMSDDLVFKFNINNICDFGLVSTLYPVFKVIPDKVSAEFLLLKLNEGEEFKRYCLMLKQGGSRTYMYLNKLKKLNLVLPSIQEQRHIIKVTNAIDKKIECNNQSLHSIEKLKKGLRQQMFA
jgi:type I restriction enzyme, S subunit